jgi:hypothetical protein
MVFGASMSKLGPNEKLYSLVKIAMVVEALKDEGVLTEDVLAGIHLSETQLTAPSCATSQHLGLGIRTHFDLPQPCSQQGLRSIAPQLRPVTRPTS